MAFIVGGASSFLTAWGLRRTVTRAVAGPLLIAFFGCTSIVSGLVDTNPDHAPAATASDVHQVVGVLGFLAVIAAMFVFARRFRSDPAWRAYTRPTLLWAIAATVTRAAQRGGAPRSADRHPHLPPADGALGRPAGEDEPLANPTAP